jgi:hypothetical protein
MRVRYVARIVVSLVVAGAVVLLGGCAAGLTGGSIPPGESRAGGVVVRGDNATVPLSGAILHFIPTTTARTTTAAEAAAAAADRAAAAGLPAAAAPAVAAR